MIKTFLTFMTAGNIKNLEPEDFKKITTILEDNPDLILVAREKHIMFFSKMSTLKIRKELWNSVDDAIRDLDLQNMRVVNQTQTFWILDSVNSPKINEMEQIAIEVAGQVDSEKNATIEEKQPQPEDKPKAESKVEDKFKPENKTGDQPKVRKRNKTKEEQINAPERKSHKTKQVQDQQEQATKPVVSSVVTDAKKQRKKKEQVVVIDHMKKNKNTLAANTTPKRRREVHEKTTKAKRA